MTAWVYDSVGVAPLLTDLDFAALLADKAFDRNVPSWPTGAPWR